MRCYTLPFGKVLMSIRRKYNIGSIINGVVNAFRGVTIIISLPGSGSPGFWYWTQSCRNNHLWCGLSCFAYLISPNQNAQQRAKIRMSWSEALEIKTLQREQGLSLTGSDKYYLSLLLIICPFLLWLPGEWKPISLREMCTCVFSEPSFVSWNARADQCASTVGQRISTRSLLPWHFGPKRTWQRCVRWAITAYSQASVWKDCQQRSPQLTDPGLIQSISGLPAVSVFHSGEIVGRITLESHKVISRPLSGHLVGFRRDPSNNHSLISCTFQQRAALGSEEVICHLTLLHSFIAIESVLLSATKDHVIWITGWPINMEQGIIIIFIRLE